MAAVAKVPQSIQMQIGGLSFISSQLLFNADGQHDLVVKADRFFCCVSGPFAYLQHQGNADLISVLPGQLWGPWNHGRISGWAQQAPTATHFHIVMMFVGQVVAANTQTALLG